MIKKIIVAACFFISLVSNAQTGSASPYSFFGIGESRFKGNLENRSMAGLSVEQDSLHINILNPASFASLKFTTFTIGGNYTSTGLKTDTKTEKAQRTALDYIAVSVPLGKMGVGFGLLPYTSVGYNIQSINSSPDGVNNVLKGTGGLNKAFFSLGYTVIPNLVVGADIQYNFGRISNTNLEFITGVFIGTQEKNEADLKGFASNFGVMYKHKIYKNINLHSSFTFSPQSRLASTNTQTKSTVNFNSNFDVTIIDPADPKEIRTDLTIPEKISFGLGVGKTKKWLLGSQIVFQNAGKLTDEFNSASNVTYGTYSSYSLGGFYVPNYNVFSKYYQKIVYRAGLKYTKTGLTVKSEDIDEKAMTLGFGLPISGGFSNINIGLEYGKRGTTAKGLIQENYFVLAMSFSLSEKWFRQAKID
ncbi:hypothetical protein [Flavobacterium sp. IMCC34518]|uniref:hypothetical protein n=1 Tax=Flavobacterium sp. IMCC34518 TaxID=3003623 RepID=UPI0022AC3763|nr:hypothetical protein [Flavobacterium sp. IMCC34518]